MSDPGMTSEQRAAVAVHYAMKNLVCRDVGAEGEICIACAEVANQIDAAVEVERQAAEERGRSGASERIAELEHKLNAQRAMVGAAHVAFHEAAGTAYGHTPAEDNPAAMIRLVAKEAEGRGRRRGVEEAAKIIKDKVREWVNNKNDRRNSVDTVVDDACTALAPREPDLFEEKARSLLEARDLNRSTIAAALRAAETNALERAAQIVEEKCYNHGPRPVSWCEYCRLAGRVRALASPAAAPAAEPGRCFCGKKAMSPSTVLVGGSSGTHTATRCDPDALRAIAYAVDSTEPPAPPSGPVAPAAEGECWSDVHWCAQHGQPLSECTAQGRAGAPATPPSGPIASASVPFGQWPVSLPLALAQRILAALEQEADLDAPFLTAQELQAIAAELRERMPK